MLFPNDAHIRSIIGLTLFIIALISNVIHVNILLKQTSIHTHLSITFDHIAESIFILICIFNLMSFISFHDLSSIFFAILSGIGGIMVYLRSYFDVRQSESIIDMNVSRYMLLTTVSAIWGGIMLMSLISRGSY